MLRPAVMFLSKLLRVYPKCRTITFVLYYPFGVISREVECVNDQRLAKSVGN